MASSLCRQLAEWDSMWSRGFIGSCGHPAAPAHACEELCAQSADPKLCLTAAMMPFIMARPPLIL